MRGEAGYRDAPHLKKGLDEGDNLEGEVDGESWSREIHVSKRE